MNDIEKKDMLDRIGQLEAGFKALDKIIRGPSDSHVLSGIIYQVTMNTKFRKIISLWLWLMTVTVSGMVLDRLFSFFTTGG